jgi:uncharacterized alkaline shock family protein YloU
MMRNAFKARIDEAGHLVAEGPDGQAIANLDIAPGVIETMVATAIEEVPGVAAVGSPKFDRSFSTTLTRDDEDAGVELMAEDGEIKLDIRIQIYYGYKLQEIVDGIRENVNDVLISQVGVSIDEINVFVTNLQFEE